MNEQDNTDVSTANVDEDKSRQVLRAENRQAVKDFRRHNNENVLKKNQSRSSSPLPLNRAGRRRFASQRADPAFRAAVIEHMAQAA